MQDSRITPSGIQAPPAYDYCTSEHKLLVLSAPYNRTACPFPGVHLCSPLSFRSFVNGSAVESGLRCVVRVALYRVPLLARRAEAALLEGCALPRQSGHGPCNDRGCKPAELAKHLTMW